MAISFPIAPMDGDIYSYQGTDYRYDNTNGNNRWIAELTTGPAVVVSQTIPDPAMNNVGDLWWYCGDTGENPGLFTLVEDISGQQQWVQTTPPEATARSNRLLFGTYAGQTIAASGTVSLTGRGPAWVSLSGGGGSGGVHINTDLVDATAGPGGRGGVIGTFLEEVSVLEGATLTLGAGGIGRRVITTGNNSDPGNAGGTSSLSWSGGSLSATGGGGGTEVNFVPGAAGTGSASGVTPLTAAELTAEAMDYWNQFAVVFGSNLRLGGRDVVIAGGGVGGAARNVHNTNPGGATIDVTSGPGGGGVLQIAYQNQ